MAKKSVHGQFILKIFPTAVLITQEMIKKEKTLNKVFLYYLHRFI